jgi:hypothetical protein
VLHAASVARDTTKGVTHYLQPQVLLGSGRQLAQMLGVETAAPTQAVYEMTKDALGIIARAGAFVGTYAAANVAVACLAVSSSVLGGVGRVTNIPSVAGIANSLNAAGMVIANNSNAWAVAAAQGAGGGIGALMEPHDPELGGPSGKELETGAILSMYDTDDQHADLVEQQRQAFEKLQNRSNS